MGRYGKSGFFNARATDTGYDRVYDAGDFAEYNALFVRSGVFATPENQLKISVSGGLNLSIANGAACIDGYYFILPEDDTISVPLNETTTEKQYYVCCTLSVSDRDIDIQLREVGATPGPVDDGNTHELVLCSFSLGTGVSVLTNAMLTDTRPDDTMCGWVRGRAELDQLLLNMINNLESEVDSNYSTLSDNIVTAKNEAKGYTDDLEKRTITYYNIDATRFNMSKPYIKFYSMWFKISSSDWNKYTTTDLYVADKIHNLNFSLGVGKKALVLGIYQYNLGFISTYGVANYGLKLNNNNDAPTTDNISGFRTILIAANTSKPNENYVLNFIFSLLVFDE